MASAHRMKFRTHPTLDLTTDDPDASVHVNGIRRQDAGRRRVSLADVLVERGPAS